MAAGPFSWGRKGRGALAAPAMAELEPILRAPLAGDPIPLAGFHIHPGANIDARIEELRQKGFPSNHPEGPRYGVEPPIDWQAKGALDRNTRHRMLGWVFLDPFIGAAERDGGGDRIPYLGAVVADWQDHAERSGDSSLWADMATGLRAQHLAAILQILRRNGGEGLGQKEQLKLLEASARHLEVLSDPGFVSPGNHGLFQLHGLALLAWALRPHARMEDYLGIARARLPEFVAEQISPDGGHLEHSAEYYLLAERVFRSLARSGLYGDLVDLDGILARLAAIRPFLFGAKGRIAASGDTSLRRQPAAVLRQDAAASGLFAGSRVSPQISALLLPQTGLYVAKGHPGSAAEDCYLHFSAGYHSVMHKHGDDLAVEWHGRGQPIVVDAGKYRYDRRDPMRRFVLSNAAHNTLEPYGLAFPILLEDPYGSGIASAKETDWGFLANGRVAYRRQGLVHERLAIFKPDAFLCLVDRVDRLDVPVASRFAGLLRRALVHPGGPNMVLRSLLRSSRRHRVWLHFAEGTELEEDSCEDREARWRLRLGAGGWAGVRQWSDRPLAGTEHAEGRRHPTPQGWIAKGYVEAVPALALGTSLDPAARLLVTLLALGEAAPPTVEVAEQDGALAFRISEGAQSGRLTLDLSAATDPGAVTYEESATA